MSLLPDSPGVCQGLGCGSELSSPVGKGADKWMGVCFLPGLTRRKCSGRVPGGGLRVGEGWRHLLVAGIQLGRLCPFTDPYPWICWAKADAAAAPWLEGLSWSTWGQCFGAGGECRQA